jgi:hypothetical protein
MIVFFRGAWGAIACALFLPQDPEKGEMASPQQLAPSKKGLRYSTEVTPQKDHPF